MSKNANKNFFGIEKQPLKIFTERAYLDYSMYVILDRALPHLADGLKPVQRRIIYAMSELGLNALAKHKKSARTIGDVLGKFHPHGESACYEAMVLMAQPFSYRYPLVDGQGNFGSADDPKSFAAMRYTEARMSKYANVLLAELDLGTVQWVPNFDGSLDEPKMLPARLPNLLLNGATGIAVGMATDVPPHNLKEVVSALIFQLENPKCTIEELCQHILAPDYPTTAEIITPRSEILKMYQTGIGSLRMRAVYSVEEGDIVITALPHGVSGSKVLEQMGALIQAKKLPQISDLRDESDHENPTRLVITPRSNRVNVDEIMTYLFASTELESSYRVNFNVIGLDGRPKVKDLKTLLSEWLEFRLATVRLRLEHRLDKVLKRLHLLDGFLIAYLNIDEVIHIIRHKDNPKAALIAKFKLSDIQAEAILELKLRHLAKLEEVKIQTEQNSLAEERQMLEKTLSSEARMKTLVKKELNEDSQLYGDERKTQLVEREVAKLVPLLEKGPSEPVTVILSSKGWVRAAKGHDIDPKSLSYKTGDEFKMAIHAKSADAIVFLDSSGRAYTLMADSLPSARGQGEPLTGRVNPPEGAYFVSVIQGEEDDMFFIMSNAGYGFMVKYSELQTKNRSGKAILKLKGEQKLFAGLKLKSDATFLALATSDGRLILLNIKDIAVMSKGKGNKLVNLGKNDTIIACVLLSAKDKLIIDSGRRTLELQASELKSYKLDLGSRAVKLPKGYPTINSLGLA